MSSYFDNAATTYPKPEVVYSFMDQFYRQQGGNAGRGQYKLASSASRIMAETRQLLQNILQCPNKEVVFSPSDTIALNQIIQGTMCSSIQTVYISHFEHNAVTRVLHHYEKAGEIHIEFLPLTNNYEYDIVATEQAFSKVPPQMVIISHASNVCGLIAPAEDIFRIAKKYNAITILDMAQTAGLVPIHTGSDNIDFAVFAGHKTLYGPIGIGGFVKSKGSSLEPVLFGGTGIDSANQDMPDSMPSRYEMGSQNIHAIAGLHAALTWMLENHDDIVSTETANHKQLLSVLSQHSNIHIIGPQERSRCIGVVSCVFDDYSSDNIGDVLDRFEIAVRTGLDCAPYAHQYLGTYPAGAVRFSSGFFTTQLDFENLETALEYIEENS